MKEIVKDREQFWLGPEQGKMLNYIMFGALIVTTILALSLGRLGPI